MGSLPRFLIPLAAGCYFPTQHQREGALKQMWLRFDWCKCLDPNRLSLFYVARGLCF